ncbi:KAP family P-loop NTPase fold protein [Wohlfahrtiimonas larvae]|uniref:KAP NTPase domain-containing protein n=1 Tax=Wohlfahrtiimonas larvae TaxID=1157986 RepID=A0ABP9MTE0_9GAMM|nr:P-loop NTPase fold protein [Wohlfahrtiimonas larvae]
MYNVDSDKKFSYRDEYERMYIANNIYQSIHGNSFYSPCLLDGQWGSGKTEFCYKLWHYIIEKNSIKTSENVNEKFILTPVYINVFNAERINNPFLTLMGGLVGSINGGEVIPASLTETAYKILFTEVSLQPIGAAAVKDAATFLLSKIKDYVPTISGEITKQINDGLSKDVSSNIFNNAFEEVNKLDSDYKKFSTELKAFATTNHPILFIVDELDRCKPDFAIQFLECIKHFFNVENVYFLLSCNVNQLLASIEHLYGSKIDSENYLNKFFKDKIPLKNNHKNIQANRAILTNNRENLNFFQDIHMPDYIEYIFITTTLRQQENIINKYQQIQKEHLNTCIGTSGNKNLSHLIIFSIAYSIIMNNITNLQEFKGDGIFKAMASNYNKNMNINLRGSFNGTDYFGNAFRDVEHLVEKIFHQYT